MVTQENLDACEHIRVFHTTGGASSETDSTGVAQQSKYKDLYGKNGYILKRVNISNYQNKGTEVEESIFLFFSSANSP